MLSLLVHICSVSQNHSLFTSILPTSLFFQMGTRSLVRIFRRHGLRRIRWITTVYQQFDGYPEVVGLELLNWLTFVEASQQSAVWLATKLVVHLRESKPEVAPYLCELGFNAVDSLYHEWVYDVIVDESRRALGIRVCDSGVQNERFEGSLAGAFAWIYGGPYDACNKQICVDEPTDLLPRRSARLHALRHKRQLVAEAECTRLRRRIAAFEATLTAAH